jgi:hypothetical protein
MAKVAP